MLVLVGSPLLGGAAWRPVASLLDARTVTPVGGSAAEVLASLLDQIPDEPDLVLVPHSNAGLYVGAVAAQRGVRAVVFVDAGIPAPDGPTPTAPAQALGFLGSLVDDEGRLPPWTRWWPEEDVAALFPDAATRAAVEAEQPRLPLSYFSDAVPPAELHVPCGYLAFGDTYAEEAARATDSGWPVTRLEGRHLHLLVDPPAVAEEIRRLVARL